MRNGAVRWADRPDENGLDQTYDIAGGPPRCGWRPTVMVI
jgi:hypothetical protein